LRSIADFFEKVDLDYELVKEIGDGLSIEPLHLIPIERDDSERIFAVFSVKERRNFLLIRKDRVDQKDRIGIEEKGDVKISDQFIVNKLRKLRSDISFNVVDHLSIISALHTGSVEHAVIEGCFISEEIREQYRIVELDSREFGHAPGQGYFAIIGDQSHQLGKVLRRYNNQDAIAICNIERKLAKISNSVINCHCEIDGNSNVHLWVFTSEGEAHISQSTRNQIEERALKELQA
jgi:hypothetical protein